jgi:hypothetical protein
MHVTSTRVALLQQMASLPLIDIIAPTRLGSAICVVEALARGGLKARHKRRDPAGGV